MISPEEDLRKQMIQMHLNKLRAQSDPRRLALQQQRQPARDNLAMAGNLAAGLDEAASQMGGTAPSKTLGATATRLNTQAEEGRPKPENKFGYDPKLFKYLDGARSKKGKLKYGPGEVDPATGDTRSFLRDEAGVKQGEGILTKSDSFARKKDLWNKYSNHPVTKKSDLLAVAYQKIRNSESTPAGDISLIFGYMKMIDPGSTVREGEAATVANAGNTPDRIRNIYNNIVKGTKLTKTQRVDFNKQAFNIWRAQEKVQNQVNARFSTFGSQNGVEFEPFDWDVKEAEDGNKTPKTITEELPIPEDTNAQTGANEPIPDDVKSMSDEELLKAAGE